MSARSFQQVRYELLLPWQLREIVARRPVAYLPLGTLEWHCEHLPVGLDALTAHGLCLRVAGHDGGVVLPPLYFGTGGDHAAYPWTIMMPKADDIERQLVHSLERLEVMGFRLAVIFSGHFADTQLEMIDRIAAQWSARGSTLSVIATAVNRIENLPIGPDHAGVFETTLLHALWPALVQIDRLPPLASAPLAEGDTWAEGRHDPSHPIWGVIGPDPRRFDPARSEQLLAACVAWLISEVQKAV